MNKQLFNEMMDRLEEILPDNWILYPNNQEMLTNAHRQLEGEYGMEIYRQFAFELDKFPSSPHE